MTTGPIVIDLEASGLHARSFPIAVAWGASPDVIERHLICPEPKWLDPPDAWDPAAEALHRLPLARLQAEGTPARTVAERLAAALEGRTVFSDAPEVDLAWLDRLHESTGVPCHYTITHISRLLPRTYDPDLNRAGYLALRRQAFRRAGVVPHTADGDVAALLMMLAIAGR